MNAGVRAPQIVPAQVLSSVRPVVLGDTVAAHIFQGRDRAAFRALFTVHADGTFAVEMTDSTGHPALDALALQAARQWTFRPATRAGVAVESYLRLRIEFEAV